MGDETGQPVAQMIDEDARDALLATAQRATSTLRQSVADKSPDTPIETNAQSLLGLAGVIDTLLVDATQCGGSDCMGRAVDGVKLWVTSDRFEALRLRAERYEDTLRSIADAVLAEGGELAMLVDWQGTARAFAASARAALEDEATPMAATGTNG